MQGKKKRDTEAAETARKALEALDANEGEAPNQKKPAPKDLVEESSGGGDLLNPKDEDVIF